MDFKYFHSLDSLDLYKKLDCQFSHCGIITSKAIFPGFQVAWVDCICLRNNLIKYEPILIDKLTKNLADQEENQILVLPLNPVYNIAAISSGWSKWCEILEKKVEHYKFPSCQICVRCFDVSDLDFVMPLMAESIKLGLPAPIRDFYKKIDIFEMTYRRIRSILDADNLAIIAEISNEPVGYCFATFEQEFTHIHDTLVVDKWRKNGISTFLTSIIEFASIEKNISILRGSISVDSLEESNSLNQSLHRNKWSTKYVHFVFKNEKSFIV
ncbi:GNAT family N-acetyltransferase [Nostoc sp. FACHB-190]|uniref:GNAT family N-acetyltransferase n=1 Tax=Nostoc sp. FACHB-190 TaxID=2692838 RepID=UPI0016853E00|nr:GNAT family N-acetyltransferase [Nostoc sp. FACHB-190]MBD2303673.1 GNAT family N-acetyltransferase [Nostoc sp. FACHB-190]